MRKRILILSILLAAVAFPIWHAFVHGYSSSTNYTCLHCRKIRHVTTSFGRERVRIEETDFSRWFDMRQATHTHQWRWCGTTITHYPISYARGCGRQHPIWEVRPEWQRAFVESASSSEVERFFAALDSPNRTAQSEAVEMVFQKACAAKQ